MGLFRFALGAGSFGCLRVVPVVAGWCWCCSVDFCGLVWYRFLVISEFWWF